MLEGAAAAVVEQLEDDDVADPSPGSSARAPSKWRNRADSRRGIPGSCFGVQDGEQGKGWRGGQKHISL